MAKKSTIKISGMHCVNCAQTVEKALKKQAGVVSANVNFATEKAVVEFDPSKVDIEKLGETIRKSGYGVIAEGEADKSEIEMRQSMTSQRDVMVQPKSKCIFRRTNYVLTWL